MRASSASYRPEHSYRKPRLDLERLAAFGRGEFIVFSGHMGSDLANVCFTEPRWRTPPLLRRGQGPRRPDWEERPSAAASPATRRLFGARTTSTSKSSWSTTRTCRPPWSWPASSVTWQEATACPRGHGRQPLLPAGGRRSTSASPVLGPGHDDEGGPAEAGRDEDVQLGAFFRSQQLPHPLARGDEGAARRPPGRTGQQPGNRRPVRAVRVGGKPLLPDFPCRAGWSPDDYLEGCAEEGWAGSRSPAASPAGRPRVRGAAGDGAAGHPVHRRVPRELLPHRRTSSATPGRSLKVKTGKGRGSAAGCLCQLPDRHHPARPHPKFGLSFERFYNAGRNSPGRIALPDIDSDFPIKVRDKVIDYIRDKYGARPGRQMATFSRMQGRGALKDVLRAHERCSFEEMNRITEHIPGRGGNRRPAPG
jgi:hypothetical protein